MLLSGGDVMQTERPEESRYSLILAQDLGCGQTDPLMNSLEEVSRPLGAYARAIPASGS
jgi:hypothetical protein